MVRNHDFVRQTFSPLSEITDCLFRVPLACCTDRHIWYGSRRMSDARRVEHKKDRDQASTPVRHEKYETHEDSFFWVLPLKGPEALPQ